MELTVSHKQCVISPSTDDSNLDSILRVPLIINKPSEESGGKYNSKRCSTGSTDPGKAIKNIDVFSRVEIIDSTLPINFKRMLIHLDVYTSPPDMVLTSFLIHDSLILGRSSSFFTRKID